MLWYSLEAPWRDASNEYPHFRGKIRKKYQHFLVEKSRLSAAMYNNLDQTVLMHWEICTGTVYKSQQVHNVDSILIQHLDVESTLN